MNEVKAIAPQRYLLPAILLIEIGMIRGQSLLLVKELQGVAPMYYVTGNHEISTNNSESIKKSLEDLGVRILSDEADILVGNDGESIAIGGLKTLLLVT